ncbi:NAD(P)/FAD-dependent oxidoreductase [Paracoccus aerodenitrificans]|uniref:NAD(P)/FAD-dependent oxidoreductase n=1 Tax=Paracoccus aerodenitrificans TaxID=3017781 RepID=UPI0022F06D34|nr:TIGR03862 family flavoprotein [Paracoccus aerodenitrificans]WBU64036.1 TIGR03862 family flavoprotein [Paracoccus aerodenitrificans]
MTEALVIGAGPAGLMAAGTIAEAGHRVILTEAMPTPARKFLMAGKSGLNLTMDEPDERFRQNISLGSGGCPPPHPQGYFSQDESRFGPAEVMGWARGLGIELFTGSTGRVFPVGMKASPLLRAWLARLRRAGVDLRTRWRWRGFDGDGYGFETPDGYRVLRPDAVVLALGGASWPRLGSDAAWVPFLTARDVGVAPFRPANMGIRINWSGKMAPFFGQPVKGTALHAGERTSRGEWVISAQGIEGGGVYSVASAIRDGALGRLDLAPDLDEAVLAKRFSVPRGKLSVGNWLRRVLGNPVKVALLLEWGQTLPRDPEDWARRVKSLPVHHEGPMGLERAISSAGGIRLDALTPSLEIRGLPGVFAAGEMLDWEAPTGGYLITHCLGQGLLAGQAAADYLAAARR